MFTRSDPPHILTHSGEYSGFLLTQKLNLWAMELKKTKQKQKTEQYSLSYLELLSLLLLSTY